jgi:hypothetical protein
MKKHFVFMSIACSLLFAACVKENEGPAGPQGPSGLTFTGVINGHVWLYDQYGTRMDTGLAGAQVTILNGSKDTTVTTDATGAYTFTNIATGNYTITAHVPNNGYGDVRLPDFQYLNDTLNKDVKMSAIPNFSPTGLTAYNTPLNDSLVITFNADPRIRSCIIFVNNTSTIGGLPSNYQLAYVKAIAAYQTKVSFTVPAGDLHDVGINTGATAYFAVFSSPVADASPYEDLASGKLVYDALNTTPVIANAIAP